MQSSELEPLQDQFVRVRLINANALDLLRFQFDYDLSFSTLFFNGDGTLYGRYGSWTHQKNAQNKTTAGYKRALESALALHRGYPANKATLVGKQGRPVEFKTPLEIPTMDGKYRTELDWNGKVVPSCVHCHQISDALRLHQRQQRKPMPDDLLYAWPGAETVGFTLAPDAAARVESVVPGSAAVQAGLQVGDELVSLAGQPLISIADVSWVLHGAPATARLPAVIRRGGAERTLTLELAEGWRAKTDLSRRVGTWGMRGMATGGLVLEDLSEDDRRTRGLEPGRMALLVKHVGEYGKHAAAKKAGFRKNDVVVELDGVSSRLTEGQVIGRILKQHMAGAKLPAVVLRDGEKVSLSLPVQ
jgi:hypothetical protein